MIILITFLIIVLFILSVLTLLLINSPGKLEPFKDENGNILKDSISEKIFVDIGGVKQGMFIRGKNINNPVLLFVHGGPCFPTYFLVDKYKPGLEDSFTVCYWEERGGGLSYNSDIPVESMNMEQLISDTIEVSNYLRNRFKQEKIYMMAHSGGTSMAIQAAAREPELYKAYVAIAQITNQAESEKLAYSYMLKRYQSEGNAAMVKKLKEFSVLEDADAFTFFKSLLRDKAMHEQGIGTMRSMTKIDKDILIPSMLCKAYTLKEKINIWVSKFSFLKKTVITDEFFKTDITKVVTRLEIPVYFFSGAYDYTVNYELSKAYLYKLEAPIKGFYTFTESAHSPVFEEPEKMMEIMRNDVLNNAVTLADAE
jgi:pimeloyl-ACP methyl ester carboxylesterase